MPSHSLLLEALFEQPVAEIKRAPDLREGHLLRTTGPQSANPPQRSSAQSYWSSRHLLCKDSFSQSSISAGQSTSLMLTKSGSPSKWFTDLGGPSFGPEWEAYCFNHRALRLRQGSDIVSMAERVWCLSCHRNRLMHCQAVC